MMSRRDSSYQLPSCSSYNSLPLTTRDHPQIIQYLAPLSNQELNNVGLRLGLRYPTLKTMSSEYLLNDMVHAWLRRDDDVMDGSGEPTWESLWTALEDCGHKDIASGIQKAGPTNSRECLRESHSKIELLPEPPPLMDEHISYHQAITGDEAYDRLKRCSSDRCYLTRFSERQQSYVLSVYQKKPKDTIRHFKIILEDGDQKLYKIEGRDRRWFNGLEEMLTFYEKNRIDHAFRSIGRCVTEQEYESGKLSPTADNKDKCDGEAKEKTTDPYQYFRPRSNTGNIPAAPSRKEMMGEHRSYHQSITGEEAVRRLKMLGRNCYLTRYSTSQDCYVLSVHRKQRPDDVIEHFEILVEKTGKHKIKRRGEDKGGGEEFESIDSLLEYYETHRISPGFPNIGRCYSEEVFYRLESKKCIIS